MADAFTIIDESRAVDVDADVVHGRVLLSPETVAEALGWTLRPEGFCRDDVCVPVREDARVMVDGKVDLAGLADLLQRPIALDLDERAAALAASSHDRGAALSTLEAPDFTLPDLDGRMHSLSAHRGKKVFLAVWASW
jgi:hypothetical protein